MNAKIQPNPKLFIIFKIYVLKPLMRTKLQNELFIVTEGLIAQWSGHRNSTISMTMAPKGSEQVAHSRAVRSAD